MRAGRRCPGRDSVRETLDGDRSKTAASVVTGPTSSAQVASPPHAPSQPAKRDPRSGSATSDSRAPKSRSTVHRSPQSTPSPRTVPEPPPALRTPKRTTTAGGMSCGKSAVPNLSDVQRRWLATTSHRLADTGALHRYGFHSPPAAAVRATRVKSGYSPRHSGGPTGGAASSHRSGDGGSLAIGGFQRAAGEADADDLRVEERHEGLAVAVDRQRAGGDRRTPEVAPSAERAGQRSRRRRTHRSRERDDGARRVAEHASAGALIEAAAAVLDPDAGARGCLRRSVVPAPGSAVTVPGPSAMRTSSASPVCADADAARASDAAAMVISTTRRNQRWASRGRMSDHLPAAPGRGWDGFDRLTARGPPPADGDFASIVRRMR